MPARGACAAGGHSLRTSLPVCGSIRAYCTASRRPPLCRLSAWMRHCGGPRPFADTTLIVDASMKHVGALHRTSPRSEGVIAAQDVDDSLVSKGGMVSASREDESDWTAF